MDKIFTTDNLPSLWKWLEEIINPNIFEDKSILDFKVNKGIHKIFPTDQEYNKLTEVNSFDKFFYDWSHASVELLMLCDYLDIECFNKAQFESIKQLWNYYRSMH